MLFRPIWSYGNERNNVLMFISHHCFDCNFYFFVITLENVPSFFFGARDVLFAPWARPTAAFVFHQQMSALYLIQSGWWIILRWMLWQIPLRLFRVDIQVIVHACDRWNTVINAINSHKTIKPIYRSIDWCVSPIRLEQLHRSNLPFCFRLKTDSIDVCNKRSA